MKKLFTTSLAVFITSSLFSQIFLQSPRYSIGHYDRVTQSIEEEPSTFETLSIFEISEDYKHLIHEFDDKVMNYIILDEFYDEQSDEYILKLLGLFSQKYLAVLKIGDRKLFFFLSDEVGGIMVKMYEIDLYAQGN